MRQLIWAILLVPLAWGGWWMAASSSLERNLAEWFELRRLEGWQAEYHSIDRAGFPTELIATIVAPALADPATGLAVEASRLDIRTPAWWPGHVTVTLPDDPVLMANPQGRSTLTATSAEAELRLHPASNLQLDRMALTSGPWSIDDPNGSLLAAGDITLAAQQDAQTRSLYVLELNAEGLRPGDIPRAILRVPNDWPLTFDRFSLEAAIEFDRPWDQSAIEDLRPQPRRIALHLAEASWGNLRIRAAGTLDVDDEGVPTGALSLQAQNWRDMLTLAETGGVLSSSIRPQVESALAALAGLGGNPEALDLQINFRGGYMAVGFVPLGPAPRLVIR